MIITTISDNGTITLPDAVIQALNLQEGDTVAFSWDGNGYIVTKHSDQEHRPDPLYG